VSARPAFARPCAPHHRPDPAASRSPPRRDGPHRAADRTERAQCALRGRPRRRSQPGPRRCRPARCGTRGRHRPPTHLPGVLMELERFLFLTVDGLARGAVLAVFALSLVLIWRAARLVNFSQGAIAMAATYLAFVVTSATGNYWLGLVAALLGGAAIGFVVERGVMRYVSSVNPLNSVIAALGVLLVIQAIIGMLFGNGYHPMKVPFSQSPLPWLSGLSISAYDLFVFACVGFVV